MSHMEVDSDLVEDEDNFSNKSTDNSSDDDDADEEKIVELQKQVFQNGLSVDSKLLHRIKM